MHVNEINNDFIIKPSHGGIVLSKPSKELDDSRMSVQNIMHNPFNIYFMRKDILIGSNHSNAETCGFDSPQSVIGTSLYDFPGITPSSVQLALDNNEHTLKLGCTNIVEEEVIRLDNYSQSVLSVKVPWYDDFNNILGIFGCSIIIDKQSIADSLTSIAKLGILNIPQPSNVSLNKNHPHLTKRELACLRLAATGKTARQMAIYFCISRRTVEHHLESIKFKLSLKTKQELIEFAQQYFYQIR